MNTRVASRLCTSFCRNLNANILPLPGNHKQFVFLKPFTSIYYRNQVISNVCKREYEESSNTTLDTISEYFENLAELDTVSSEFDVNLESGVLTIVISKAIGTYVINKQSPNKQIWLSSPLSGPKRYEFVNNSWLYIHDGKYLHQLLEEEFSEILNTKVDLSGLPYYYTQANNM